MFTMYFKQRVDRFATTFILLYFSLNKYQSGFKTEHAWKQYYLYDLIDKGKEKGDSWTDLSSGSDDIYYLSDMRL